MYHVLNCHESIKSCHKSNKNEFFCLFLYQKNT